MTATEVQKQETGVGIPIRAVDLAREIERLCLEMGLSAEGFLAERAHASEPDWVHDFSFG